MWPLPDLPPTPALSAAIQFGQEPRPFFSDCQDYARRDGRCGVLRACPGWLQVVSNHPSRRDIHNLRNSLCGGSPDGVPRVCCPIDAGSVIQPVPPPRPTPRPTQRPTPRPTQRPTPRPTQRPTQGPDGERIPEEHPNRRLLPNDINCGSNIDDRIVGGELADIGEYPWLAILGYEGVWTAMDSFRCAGF